MHLCTLDGRFKLTVSVGLQLHNAQLCAPEQEYVGEKQTTQHSSFFSTTEPRRLISRQEKSWEVEHP